MKSVKISIKCEIIKASTVFPELIELLREKVPFLQQFQRNGLIWMFWLI